jgi:hypothetical protein
MSREHAFTEEERSELGLRGLLPTAVEALEQHSLAGGVSRPGGGGASRSRGGDDGPQFPPLLVEEVAGHGSQRLCHHGRELHLCEHVALQVDAGGAPEAGHDALPCDALVLVTTTGPAPTRALARPDPSALEPGGCCTLACAPAPVPGVSLYERAAYFCRLCTGNVRSNPKEKCEPS